MIQHGLPFPFFISFFISFLHFCLSPFFFLFLSSFFSQINKNLINLILGWTKIYAKTQCDTMVPFISVCLSLPHWCFTLRLSLRNYIMYQSRELQFAARTMLPPTPPNKKKTHKKECFYYSIVQIVNIAGGLGKRL